MTTAKGTIDLDAILEETIQTEKLSDTSKPVEPAEKELKLRVVNDDVKPWLAFSANVPKDYRDKWTKMVKIDIETEIVSKFQMSYAYNNWNGAPPAKNRSLHDLVKKAEFFQSILKLRSVTYLIWSGIMWR
jgi:hypothetical protein